MTYQELLTHIKIFEGYRSNVYKDPGKGILTVGYGFTASCFENKQVPESMTKEQADDLLDHLVSNYMISVECYLKGWSYTQSEIELMLFPLVDFVYNCGFANLKSLTKTGARTVEQISDKILLYNKAGSKVLPGLTKRREWESQCIKEALNISKKNQGYCVSDLQKIVNKIYGKDVLVVDGIFGKNTLKYTCELLHKYL